MYRLITTATLIILLMIVCGCYTSPQTPAIRSDVISFIGYDDETAVSHLTSFLRLNGWKISKQGKSFVNVVRKEFTYSLEPAIHNEAEELIDLLKNHLVVNSKRKIQK